MQRGCLPRKRAVQLTKMQSRDSQGSAYGPVSGCCDRSHLRVWERVARFVPSERSASPAPARGIAEYGAPVLRSYCHTGCPGTWTLGRLGKSELRSGNDEVTHAAVAIVLLDRTLAQYGTQTHAVRSLLRAAVASALDKVFSEHSHGVSDLDTGRVPGPGERLQAELWKLTRRCFSGWRGPDDRGVESTS